MEKDIFDDRSMNSDDCSPFGRARLTCLKSKRSSSAKGSQIFDHIEVNQGSNTHRENSQGEFGTEAFPFEMLDYTDMVSPPNRGVKKKNEKTMSGIRRQRSHSGDLDKCDD